MDTNNNQTQTAIVAWVQPDLLGKDAIKKDQDGIRRSLVKLDAAIHANVIQCYLHAEKHGDTSLMRRLLVEIVDAKSGYRRQGIIGHMRMFTPMELVGDVIKLSGVNSKGEKKPWDIETADKTPFTSIRSLNEQLAKPIFRENLMSKLEGAIREFERAKSNTVNGQPVDATKPYFAGQHLDKLEEFFAETQKGITNLSAIRDASKDVYVARKTIADAQRDMEIASSEDPSVAAQVAAAKAAKPETVAA